MQIKLSTDILQDALRVIGRLAPPSSGNVNLSSDGKKVYLHSDAPASRVTVLLACEVSGKAASFAISYDALRDATKGRKELEAVYDKTMLKIKSGAYSTQLATQDALTLEYDEEKEVGKPLTVTPEQAAWLRKAVSVVALKASAQEQGYMPLGIRLTPKGAFVSCYDIEHVAYIKSKEITGELEVTLPLDISQAVLDVFQNVSFKMTVGRANLHVKNKLVSVYLSLPQDDGEDNKLTLKEVIAQSKEAAEQKGATLEIPKKAFLDFIDNARAVCTKEKPELVVETKDGKLKLLVETVNGSAKQLIKSDTKKALAFKIDYEYVEEAVRKAGDTVIMKVVGDAFVSFERSSGGLESTTIVAMNQE